MHPLLSFLAASALAGADLLILARATAGLGAQPTRKQAAMLALGVALKLALLLAGVAWLSRQDWNDRRAMMAGLLAPFALFVAWQALRLHLRAGKRA